MRRKDRWHCSTSSCSNDEDAVLCIEGIDCSAARHTSLASMDGIARVQIGRMKNDGQCYSLPILPLCLKELCLIRVDDKNISNAVESQRELLSLSIQKTSLEKVTAALFSPIWKSRFENLSQEKWSKLQKLEELNLTECRLQKFPFPIGELPALKRLDLSDNSELKCLPEDIGSKLQNLEEIKVSSCGLEKLPISLSNLTALKKLDLSGNSGLKSLPEDIGSKLQNLEEINMWMCGLQQLPNSLSNLTSLKKLDLGGNCELKRLSKDIGSKLKNLEELNLWGCGLQQLPNSLSNLTALKNLNLSENKK
ncbi:uncharacterized protein [Oscarella lobularis]|uniref:uncharacterized protein isoform X1 n=1 Tax=Oscarella lobularis TaxID=121494 RepID=UPI003314499C